MRRNSQSSGRGSGRGRHSEAHYLELLATPGAEAREIDGEIVVFARPGKVTLRVGAMPAVLLKALLSDGAVEAVAAGRYGISAAGHARLRRMATPGEAPFRDSQLDVATAAEGRSVNMGESPLLWLFRRGGRAGGGLIGPAEFAAGERLRSEITLGALMPRLTANWDRLPASAAGTGLTAGEALTAARQRVNAALEAVGPEFSGLLLDVCGFLKGLDQVERERGWPARSAKVVLALGLARLARHYGLANSATGVSSRRRHRWGADGYRPEFARPEARAPEIALAQPSA